MPQNIGASLNKEGTIDALILRYVKHDTFIKGLAMATQNMRRPILDHFRNFTTPSGRRYGANKLAGMQRHNVTAVLAGKTPNAQRNWLKAIRGLIAFGIEQGECTVDPSAGIKPDRGIKSAGHMTWKPPQIALYRERHAVGTTARLALELMLNVAARREDAHKLGRQHMSFDTDHQVWKLTWRPSKTSALHRQDADDPDPARPASGTRRDAEKQCTQLPDDRHGQPFASAAAFGGKFADWCIAAGLKPVLCDDGKTRNYRAHGLAQGRDVHALQGGRQRR